MHANIHLSWRKIHKFKSFQNNVEKKFTNLCFGFSWRVGQRKINSHIVLRSLERKKAPAWQFSPTKYLHHAYRRHYSSGNQFWWRTQKDTYSQDIATPTSMMPAGNITKWLIEFIEANDRHTIPAKTSARVLTTILCFQVNHTMWEQHWIVFIDSNKLFIAKLDEEKRNL